MGFFSDFIGSFTGSNERKAARNAASGFAEGIRFTKEQIAQSREDTRELAAAAFQNIQAGLGAGIDTTKQALAAQLQLLGAGTEALSPEGARNSLTRAVQQGNQALVGGPNRPQKPLPFTPIGTSPIDVEPPQFNSPLLGN